VPLKTTDGGDRTVLSFQYQLLTEDILQHISHSLKTFTCSSKHHVSKTHNWWTDGRTWSLPL